MRGCSLDRTRVVAIVVLLAGLSLSLRTYDLASTGQNLFYAASVRSMLDSWHNFLFVSFEPGGSLAIDKPPLGFWLQAGAAWLLGFHYWVLAVPQVIAGVAAVLVLFWMLLPRCGLKVATTAAALLAITPISIASARNNSLDTITMFLLLLAAWSLLRALDSGHDRWLIFTAVLVGLAFNTKMFMAFLPLPAFRHCVRMGAPTRAKEVTRSHAHSRHICCRIACVGRARRDDTRFQTPVRL